MDHSLATIADAGNRLSAPGIHALAVYYRHTEIPIGANEANTPDSAGCKSSNCNAGEWHVSWVAKFDPIKGDTRNNYQDCFALYRKTLAAQADHSVVIVGTGFATCLMQLLDSPADSYSRLTGAQLVKEKVKSLVIMGGDYPTGNEWNFVTDSANYFKLFSEWRSQNGFPRLYMSGFNLGLIACSGVPATGSIETNPIRNANVAIRRSVGANPICKSAEQGPVWDQQAIMFGAWGPQHGGKVYFNISAGGTNEVDPATGPIHGRLSKTLATTTSSRRLTAKILSSFSMVVQIMGCCLSSSTNGELGWVRLQNILSPQGRACEELQNCSSRGRD